MSCQTIGFLGLLVLCLPSSGLAQSVSAQRIAYDLTAMYEAVNPSIVKVHLDAGSGSGFLVGADGLIATNHHVVRNSRSIAVELANQRRFYADIVMLDAQFDLAILKINRDVAAAMKPLALLPAERDGSVKGGHAGGCVWLAAEHYVPHDPRHRLKGRGTSAIRRLLDQSR